MAKAKKKSSSPFFEMFKKVQIVLWIFILFISLFFVGINYGLLGEMPDLEAIQNPNNAITTTVYTSDYEVLGTYYTQNRIEIAYQDLSPYLVQGLVATEDKRFYEHSGIDLKSLFRAVIRTGLLGQEGGGGSTLTQQLAKNLFHEDFMRAGTIKRMTQKLKEWVLAAKLERTFTKEEIINIYFNTIGFGYNSYGIKTASFTYFYKTPAELKPDEAALLVGMLNGPSFYNPRLHPERAIVRRNLVLRRMREAGYLTQKEYNEYSVKPIKLNFHNPDFREGIGTYIREQIRQDLKAWCEANTKPNGSKWNIYEDGLKVFTTIDSRMQQHAEEAMSEHLRELQMQFFKEWRGKEPWKFGSRAKPDLLEKMMKQSERYITMKAAGASEKQIKDAFNTKTAMSVFSWNAEKSSTMDTVMTPMDSLRYYLQMIQVGFLAVDAQSGAIKAWIGGPNIRYFQLDHARKSTKRQVGSTFKPFQYALAVERGFEPCTPIPYVAPQFEGNNKVWDPSATDRWKEGDLVPMQEGLWFSDNRITAQLMSETGPEALVEYARRLQIESPLEAVPALCLGVSDISLYEMVGAYTCLANQGKYSKPYYITRIEDKDGNVLARFGVQHRDAIPENTAYVTTRMLQGAIDKGTASRLRSRYGLKMPLAGKTGTTQGNADAWFIGYTPNLVVGSWVGFDQPSVHFASNSSGAGATAALPIVGGFLRKIYSDKTLNVASADFVKPENFEHDEQWFECLMDSAEVKITTTP